jgi:GntR family transcriptional regulator/MocR family aminotransferase
MRPEILDYDQFEPAGLPVLRAATADYVARTRGVRATAESVVVVAEFTQGRLAPVARAPRRLGARCAATEDPGFGLYRNLLGAAGLRTVRLRVGDGGAAPGDLTGEVALVMLTAAHQYPRGVVLAPDRRMAFVALARRQDAYIVEDDYDDDGEFRYD